MSRRNSTRIERRTTIDFRSPDRAVRLSNATCPEEACIADLPPSDCENDESPGCLGSDSIAPTSPKRLRPFLAREIIVQKLALHSPENCPHGPNSSCTHENTCPMPGKTIKDPGYQMDGSIGLICDYLFLLSQVKSINEAMKIDHPALNLVPKHSIFGRKYGFFKELHKPSADYRKTPTPTDFNPVQYYFDAEYRHQTGQILFKAFTAFRNNMGFQLLVAPFACMHCQVPIPLVACDIKSHLESHAHATALNTGIWTLPVTDKSDKCDPIHQLWINQTKDALKFGLKIEWSPAICSAERSLLTIPIKASSAPGEPVTTCIDVPHYQFEKSDTQKFRLLFTAPNVTTHNFYLQRSHIGTYLSIHGFEPTLKPMTLEVSTRKEADGTVSTVQSTYLSICMMPNTGFGLHLQMLDFYAIPKQHGAPGFCYHYPFSYCVQSDGVLSAFRELASDTRRPSPASIAKLRISHMDAPMRSGGGVPDPNSANINSWKLNFLPLANYQKLVIPAITRSWRRISSHTEDRLIAGHLVAMSDVSL
jgi:hypothetical protein